MNKNKFWTTFVVLFIIYALTNWLIHGVILTSVYSSEDISRLMRPAEQMDSMMWMMILLDLIWAFFFTLFFVKGYEGKGIMEGIRFGFYMGIFVSLVNAYVDYIVHPIPYSLAFQWFVYGMIQMMILGIVAASIYKKKEAPVG